MIAIARERVTTIMATVPVRGRLDARLEDELDECLECIGDEALCSCVRAHFSPNINEGELSELDEVKDLVLAQVGRRRTERVVYPLISRQRARNLTAHNAVSA